MDSIIQMFQAELESDMAKALIHSPECNSLRNEISEQLREIESELTEEGKKRLMRVDELQGKLLVLESDVTFSRGFRCGLDLMWKIGWEELINSKSLGN